MSGQGAVRVVLVDDHAVVRRGLAEVLAHAGGIEVVGLAGDGAAAVAMVADLVPDVVLMDLQMPGMDGVAATRRIRAASPHAQVLVLTSYSDSERIVAALDAGAMGYLLKDAEPEEIVAGVMAVHQGQSPLDPRAARELLQARSTPTRASLSPRETEVLRLVQEGLANKQIARRLGISERTVKAHLTSVFEAIGVVDRTQAAVWAERHLPQ